MEGELRQVVEQTLSMKPNFAYTLKEVQHDVQRVFDSGFFSRCQPRAEDTRDGVKLTVEVCSAAGGSGAVLLLLLALRGGALTTVLDSEIGGE